MFDVSPLSTPVFSQHFSYNLIFFFSLYRKTLKEFQGQVYIRICNCGATVIRDIVFIFSAVEKTRVVRHTVCYRRDGKRINSFVTNGIPVYPLFAKSVWMLFPNMGRVTSISSFTGSYMKMNPMLGIIFPVGVAYSRFPKAAFSAEPSALVTARIQLCEALQ